MSQPDKSIPQTTSLFDAKALDTLRQQLIETLGVELAKSILARFGYIQGQNDARALAKRPRQEAETDGSTVDLFIHTLQGLIQFDPQETTYDTESGQFYTRGVCLDSYQAQRHLQLFGTSNHPVCWTRTGYASGYASALFGQALQAVETECVAQGDARCHWEIRPTAEWKADAGISPTEAEPKTADLATQLAQANRKLQDRNEQLARQGRRLAALNEITAAVSAALAPGTIFQAVAREMQTVLPFDWANIALYDSEINAIRAFNVQADKPTDVTKAQTWPVEGTGIGYVIRTGQHLFYTDISQPDAQDYLENRWLTREGIRSTISVPLQQDNHVIGSFHIGHRQRRAYDEEDLALLHQITAQIAIALKNARLFEELEKTAAKAEQQASQLSTLLRVFQQVQAVTDLQTQIQAIAEGVVESGLFRRVLLRIFDDASQTMQTYSGYAGLTADEISQLESKPPMSKDRRSLLLQERFRISNSYFVPAGQLPDTGDAVIIESRRSDQTFQDWQPLDQLLVPLWIGDRMVGAMSVDEPFDGQRPTKESLLPLELFAKLAARMIENSRMLDDSEKLSQTVLALSQADTLAEITQTTVQQLRRLVEADWVVMYLVDPDRQRLLDLTEAGHSFETLEFMSFDEIWRGLGGHALRNNTPILSLDADDPREREDNQQRRKRLGMGSLIILPLVDEEQNPIGGITLVNHADRRQFTERDLDLLMALAGQVSISLRNLRLLDDAQRRAVQLQTAADVSRAASSILDLKVLFTDIIELIRQRFGYYYVGLFLADQDNRWAVLQAGTGQAGQRQVEKEHRLRIGGESMIGQAIANAQARIALDVGQEAVRFENPHLPKTRSEMALPLLTRGQAIGAMTIQSEQEAAFSEQDITVLQTMADQVAAAIHNARLLEETQQALEEVQRLHRSYIRESWEEYLVGRAESTITDYVLERQQIIPTPGLQRPEIDLVLQQNRTVVKTRGETLSPGSDENATSITVPITLRGQVVGVLGVEDPDGEQPWTDDDIALLEAVTTQLGLAIDNARLSEQTRSSLAEVQTLFETSRSLAAAQQMEEIWQAVIEAARKRRADACGLFLFDTLERNSAQNLVLSTAWDRQEPIRMPVGSQLPLSNFDQFETLRADRPFFVADVDQARNIDQATRNLLNSMGFVALLHQPVAVRGSWFGLLSVLYESPHTFTKSETDFYRTLADQAALAIEGQRLLTESQRRAEREQMIRQITDKVRATPNIETILQTTVQELSKAMGLPRAFVRLGTEKELRDAIQPQKQ